MHLVYWLVLVANIICDAGIKLEVIVWQKSHICHAEYYIPRGQCVPLLTYNVDLCLL